MSMLNEIIDAISDFYTKTERQPNVIYLGYITHEIMKDEADMWLNMAGITRSERSISQQIVGVRYEVLKDTKHHLGVGIEY